MRFVLTLCSVLGAGAVSLADCRSAQPVRRIVQQAVVQKQVVTPVTVATFVPVPIAVAQYSVGYQQESNQDLVKAIEELRKEIAGLRSAQPQPASQDTAEAKAMRVLMTRCAGCHGEAVAEKKGGKFAMFGSGGQFKPSEFADLIDMVQRADSGSMPPPPTQSIPDEEVSLLKAWLHEKAQARKAERTKLGGN